MRLEIDHLPQHAPEPSWAWSLERADGSAVTQHGARWGELSMFSWPGAPTLRPEDPWHLRQLLITVQAYKTLSVRAGHRFVTLSQTGRTSHFIRGFPTPDMDDTLARYGLFTRSGRIEHLTISPDGFVTCAIDADHVSYVREAIAIAEHAAAGQLTRAAPLSHESI